MASNKRKKIFPKPPVRFHSKLAKELGKYSNKIGYDATLEAIYLQKENRSLVEANQKQTDQLDKLRQILKERKELCQKSN